MKVDSIHTHNNEVYRLQEIRRVDRRHLERVQDEARIKHNREVDEAKRIEMNKRMNRNGQNVDRLA
jgi:hypothetical protein